MSKQSTGAFEVLVEQPYGPAHSRPPPAPAMRRQRRRWVWLVPAIVLACVVVFVVTMYVNNCPANIVGLAGETCFASFLGRFSFQPLKENPLLGPSAATLVKMGAIDVSMVVHGNQGWRLISAIWLHSGVVHILINMLCLIFIGIRLEREFGFLRVGLIYLISGYGGSLMSALFIQNTISVGASGALFGLVGSMLSELIINWKLYSNKVCALFSLVFIIALNLALGVLIPHVDNFAHLGGLVTGFLLGFVVFMCPQFGWVSRKRASAGQQPGYVEHKYQFYQYVLCVAAACTLVVGLIVASVLLFRGYNANDHCSWCHYLSCVPTKLTQCSSSPTYCTATQNGNMLNITCEGTGRSQTYNLPNATQAQLSQVCTQLCT